MPILIRWRTFESFVKILAPKLRPAILEMLQRLPYHGHLWQKHLQVLPESKSKYCFTKKVERRRKKENSSLNLCTGLVWTHRCFFRNGNAK
uniref:MATE efflux family protein 1 n=2 Tax=Rhizophora mucronata TaxID=61149 RepID=A0A2P2M472_RHIMU